jgi:predicted Na+-dependent transporter
MQTGLLHLHNSLRWIILILLVLSIMQSFAGWTGKKSFKKSDKKTWLFTMISAHITLLLGLYQVMFGRYGFFVTTLPEGLSVMKDKFYRFYWVEHPTTMILAIVFITLGYGMSKKQVSDEIKYKKAFIYFLIALLLILVGVPWQFREIVGRPYFPGM